MNELLKINYDTETPTVSARDLHEALGIRERFSLWFSRYSDVFELLFCQKPTPTLHSF